MCDDHTEYELISGLLQYQRHVLLLLASVSAVVNVGFLVFVVRGCQSEEMPTKRFLFVLNRSAADMVTALVTLVYLIISISTPCLEDTHLGCTAQDTIAHPLPLQVAISLDFWNVAVSYSGVALLIVYAVRNPIIYKTRLTVMHVYTFIACSWVLLLVVLSAIYMKHGWGSSFDSNGMIYMMLHGYFPTELSYWLSDLCSNMGRQEPVLMATLSLALPIFLLVLAAASYIMVARALCSRRGSAALHQNALLRLGMHLALFAVTVGLMAVTYVVSIPIPKYCRGEGDCGINPFWSYSFLSAVSSFGWFLRMSLDPIIDVAVDATLRRSLFPRQRHRLSTFTLSTENHRFSVTTRTSVPVDAILVATRV